jgi:hypothetical protein
VSSARKSEIRPQVERIYISSAYCVHRREGAEIAGVISPAMLETHRGRKRVPRSHFEFSLDCHFVRVGHYATSRKVTGSRPD